MLMQEEKAKRNTWKIGIIEDLISGKNKVVRGAKVRKLVSGKPEILHRPLQKLIPLESYQRKNEGKCKNGRKKRK